MNSAEEIRQAMYEARKARDVMWDVVLNELGSRNPSAAREARAVMGSMRVLPIVGYSTFAAALAWRYLDYRARRDWLWVCQGVQQIWVRGVMEIVATKLTATKPDEVEYTSTSPATMENTTPEPTAPEPAGVKPAAPVPTAPVPARVKPTRVKPIR